MSAAENAWQQRGACIGLDPNLFITGAELAIAAAKAVCAGCEVRDQCLEYATANTDLVGVWGGTDDSERASAPTGRRRKRYGEQAVTYLRHRGEASAAEIAVAVGCDANNIYSVLRWAERSGTIARHRRPHPELDRFYAPERHEDFRSSATISGTGDDCESSRPLAHSPQSERTTR